MTRREQLVSEEKLEDMTFGAWVHMLKYELQVTGKLTEKEAKRYLGRVDDWAPWRSAYDDGYFPEDVAVDAMSYWEET